MIFQNFIESLNSDPPTDHTTTSHSSIRKYNPPKEAGSLMAVVGGRRVWVTE